MYRRWDKLRKDFRKKSGKFNISKIPDIYDCIKYDYQHNQQFLHYDKSELFFQCAKFMADLVVPMEYGITVQVRGKKGINGEKLWQRKGRMV